MPAVKDVFYRKLKPAARNKVAINCCYCTCLWVLICEASFTIDCSSAIEGNDFYSRIKKLIRRKTVSVSSLTVGDSLFTSRLDLIE